MRRKDPEFKRLAEMIAFCEDERMPGVQAADMISYVTRQVHTRSEGSVHAVIDKLDRIYSPGTPDLKNLRYASSELGEGSFVDEQ